MPGLFLPDFPSYRSVSLLKSTDFMNFIEKKIYSLDEFTGSVPAKKFEDGIDFVPTPKGILLGHHFTSIAGAAPIIGPCIAAYWGWLPAFLWIVFGAIFIGAVHDFGALVVSVREKGNTIADITGIILNKKVKAIFLFFVMMLSWLVMAVFSMAIAGLFVNIPTAVLPINVEIVIAILLGFLLHKKNNNPLILSAIGLVLLYFFIYIDYSWKINKYCIMYSFKLKYLFFKFNRMYF